MVRIAIKNIERRGPINTYNYVTYLYFEVTNRRTLYSIIIILKRYLYGDLQSILTNRSDLENIK